MFANKASGPVQRELFLGLQIEYDAPSGNSVGIRRFARIDTPLGDKSPVDRVTCALFRRRRKGLQSVRAFVIQNVKCPVHRP